jgi:hypothetical protein
MAMLLFPVELMSAESPMAIFRLPLALPESAPAPIAVLVSPSVLAKSA